MANISEWVFSLDLLDGIGTVGVLGYVGAYLALQLGMLKGDGYVFPSINLVASLAVLGVLGTVT